MNGSSVFGVPAGFDVSSLQTNFLYKPGLTGGQSAFGGIAAGELLTLTGADSGGADSGRVVIESPVDFTYDTISNTTPAEAYVMRYAETVTISGAYVGGFLRFDPDFTVTTGVFIPGVFVDGGIFRVGAAPGFWAYTFINVISNIENSGNFNLGNALITNVGLTHRRITAGTSTVPQGTTGMNFSPQTRSNIAGGVMRKIGGDIAVTVNPTWSAVGGGTADMGTTVGLRVGGNAMVALGGSGAGTLIRDGIYGLDFLATTDATGGDKVVVRSAMAAAADRYFLQNNGGAQSEFGSSIAHFNDNFGLFFGGTPAVTDASLVWLAAGGLRTFFTANSDFFVVSNAVNAQILHDYSANEITFNTTAGFSLGAQTGTNGNQFGNFVAGAQSVTVGGEYSQFLLTQGGNVTADAAMGLIAGWTINAPSITLGTGTVTTAGALNVGGNVNQGSVNRFGVRILSNPSGGSGVNAGLWVTAGLSRFDGRVDINNGIALGGGAAATLGTIGGSGPTAAAQAQWVEIDIGGTPHWIPVWT